MLQEQNELQFTLTEIPDAHGANIVAIGVGGGGSNMIAHLIASHVHESVKLIAANTDIQHLKRSPAKIRIPLGEKLTRGLGAGMRPEIGRQAAEENYDNIIEALKGADIVFVSAGLGGGTGTGAAPIVAKAAQEVGALTIGVVTKPFMMEAPKRMKIAEEGLKELRGHCDSVIVIPNEKLLSIIGRNTGLKESFREVDAILARAVNGISNVILHTGENDMNTDFADLRTVMSNRGLALMGIGEAQGENAALEAVKKAIESPLLDNLSINGSKGVLISYELHSDYPLIELNEATSLIREAISEDADMILGTRTIDDMQKDQIRVIIVATGFEKEVLNNTTTPPAQNPQAAAPFFQTIDAGSIAKISGGENFDINDLDTPTFMRRQRD